MTSSLVGSEMCIRDSSIVEAINEVQSSSGGGERGGLTEVILNDYANDYDAVSYTHLTLPTICSV
eukprot:12742610-Prorocentrum_lima.AAC.1